MWLLVNGTATKLNNITPNRTEYERINWYPATAGAQIFFGCYGLTHPLTPT
jgi:hypothetical protein